MWEITGTTSEEPVSNHRETSAEDKHGQDGLDQQNLAAAGSRLSHQDGRGEKHSSHQADGLTNDEMLQC
jgi:hypothetical protein